MFKRVANILDDARGKKIAIGERPVGQWCAITPDYFATMGIPILAGRAINDGMGTWMGGRHDFTSARAAGTSRCRSLSGAFAARASTIVHCETHPPDWVCVAHQLGQ